MEAPLIEWFVLSFFVFDLLLVFGSLHFLPLSLHLHLFYHPVCQKLQSQKTKRLPLQLCHDRLKMPRDWFSDGQLPCN